jgi:hypothetical protein
MNFWKTINDKHIPPTNLQMKRTRRTKKMKRMMRTRRKKFLNVHSCNYGSQIIYLVVY